MITYATVCSGIEAPSVAWEPLGWKPLWFSEIDEAPSRLLAQRFPTVPNLGDLLTLEPSGAVPDVLIGGTPCQAFSYSGERESMNDPRGRLTMAFVELAINTWFLNEQATVIWENVPGVLNTKDNAFGNFIMALAYGLGADYVVGTPPDGKWPEAGVGSGPCATVAWRVLDAQHFGLPQRRRRVYVVASLVPGRAEQILFEFTRGKGNTGQDVQAQRDNEPSGRGAAPVYCVHGTQDPIVSLNHTHPLQASGGGNTHIVCSDTFAPRRLTPVECERLQGFPDGWTEPVGTDTARYKALGNSMSVPVIRWLGKRIDQTVKNSLTPQ